MFDKIKDWPWYGKVINIMAIIFFIMILVITWFLYQGDDACLDDYVCADGQYLSYCPPCKKPCIVTKEFCLKYGGYWSGAYCKLDYASYNREVCLKSGGKWHPAQGFFEISSCDFTLKCELE